jgi:hypothetical protein
MRVACSRFISITPVAAGPERPYLQNAPKRFSGHRPNVSLSSVSCAAHDPDGEIE